MQATGKKSGSVLAFSLYAVGVSTLEICAYVFKGLFSIVAARAWLLAGAIVLVCSLQKIWSTFRRDVGERFVWGFVATALAAFVTFWKLQSFDYFFNGEGARQTTLGLQNWGLADLAYTACGHYCYPSRQFLLAALPAKFFGRNLVSLRLGYLWIFFLGMLLFYAGLREKLRSVSNGSYLAAIGMLSILTFPYVVFWIREPEQCVMPPALMLAATGWYLFALVEAEPVSVLCLSWIGAMLATTYTPALAGWALTVSMLLLTATAKIKEGKRRQAALLVLALVIIVAFGLSSFITRGDITLKLYQERRGSPADIWKQITGGYQGVFFGNLRRENETFMSLLWLLPANLYLVTSLFWKNGVAHFLTSAWVIGVVGTSVYMQGYAPGSPGDDLMKAMILVPPLVAGTLIVAGEWLEHAHASLRRNAGVLFLLLAIYAGWNLKFSHEVFLDTHYRRLFEAVEWSLTVASERGVVDRPTDFYMFSQYDFNAPDFLAYFFPKFQNLYRDRKQCFADFVPARNAIILYDEEDCNGPLQDLRTAHAGFYELPVKYGLKGFIFIPPTGARPPHAKVQGMTSTG